MPAYRGASLVSLSAMMVPFLFSAVANAEIDITPRITAQAIYTDNVQLTEIDRQSDIVLVGAPGVTIKAERPRHYLNVSYEVSGIMAASDTSLNQVRQNLASTLRSEIVRETFFIQGNAFLGQRFADVTGAVSSNIGNITRNRRNVKSFRVTPILRRAFGVFADAELSYTFGYTDFDRVSGGQVVSDIDDSTLNLGRARLSSGPAFTKLSWSATGIYEDIDRNDNRQLRRKSGIGDFAYAFSAPIQIVGSAGYEDLRDTSLGRVDKGFIWDAGLRLRPGPRTFIEGRAGERFGGTVFNGSLRYRIDQRHTLVANYSEDIQVFGRGAIDQLGDIADIVDGVPVDADGNPIDVLSPGLNPTGQAFRQKLATLGLNRQSRKLSTHVRGYWERRQFSAGSTEQESYGGTVGVTYALGARNTILASANYRNTIGGQNFNADFLSATIRYELRLGKSVNASAAYIRSERNRNIGRDLVENAVALSVRATF